MADASANGSKYNGAAEALPSERAMARGRSSLFIGVSRFWMLFIPEVQDDSCDRPAQTETLSLMSAT